MNPIAFTPAFQLIIVAGWLNVFGAIHQASAQGNTDPISSFALNTSDQTVALSWFGVNGALYQMESSSNLSAWTNAGPVLTGGGSSLVFTGSIAGQHRVLYRLKRVISAVFDPQTGVLTIVGDELDNTIVVSRDGPGALRVNNGAAIISGGVPTVANTTLIQIFGRAGNDQLSLDETNGGLPKTDLFGEAGNDILTGGSGADTIAGGQGNDTALLGAGDDSFQWDPGDGSDTVEGQAGNDTLIFNASAANDLMDFSAVGSRLRLSRNVGNIIMDVAGVESAQVNALGGMDTITVNDLSTTEVNAVILNLAVGGGSDVQVDSVVVHGTSGIDTINALQAGTSASITGLKATVSILAGDATDTITINGQGGNDTIDASGLTTLFALTVDGGGGDDTITGGSLADVLIGGDDRDTIIGRQGNDTALLGAGDDSFRWDPGDGSDTVEGQAGNDTLIFNTSAVNDLMDFSAVGSRLRLSRNVGNIIMDVAGIESAQVNALGGTDTITINDLSATEVNAVSLNLAVGGGSDAQVDSVVVHGTSGSDTINALQAGTSASITGLKATVSILAGDATDAITINGQGGNDTIDASGLTTLFALTLDGGGGDDAITGGSLADVLIGGDDQDTLTGRQGTDALFGGAGNDTFVWNPGDGSDVLEGQDGADTLLFNASAAPDIVDISAVGGRLRFSRNVGNVVMDGNGVESVRFEAAGGADTITVGDLSATDVTAVRINLASNPGGSGGDAQSDSIIVNGTAGNDTATLSAPSGNVTLAGLSTMVVLSGSEAANDRITINTLGGTDNVDASALPAGFIMFVADGGADADVLTGSDGADTLLGGLGDDVLKGGPGVDVLDGGPGNNTIIQD